MELKPCPFCGVDTKTNDHTDDCYFNIVDGYGYAMTNNEQESHYNRVVKAWNQRVKESDDE